MKTSCVGAPPHTPPRGFNSSLGRLWDMCISAGGWQGADCSCGGRIWTPFSVGYPPLHPCPASFRHQPSASSHVVSEYCGFRYERERVFKQRILPTAAAPCKVRNGSAIVVPRCCLKGAWATLSLASFQVERKRLESLKLSWPSRLA